MPNRRAATQLLATCVATAVLLGLSGCDLPSAADRSADPTGSASHQPPTADQPEASARPTAQTRAVELDGVVLQVLSDEAATVGPVDSSPDARTVAVSLPQDGSAQLALTSPGTLDVDTDGSIAVLDDAGDPGAAVGPPVLSTGSDTGAGDEQEEADRRVTVERTDDTHAELTVEARRGQDGAGAQGTGRPGRVNFTVVVGTRAIESATWGENEGGRSLAVDPADWARHAGDAGLDLIRTQLAAAEPEAASTTMEDQLVCHALGAPDKNTWNLEPWRPEVGLILTATAHCNPV